MFLIYVCYSYFQSAQFLLDRLSRRLLCGTSNEIPEMRAVAAPILFVVVKLKKIIVASFFYHEILLVVARTIKL